MKRLAFVELKSVSTDSFRAIYAEWKGGIDAPILVDINLLNDENFLLLPFLLQRIENHDDKTAVFIRVDWRAMVVRWIHRIWWGK